MGSNPRKLDQNKTWKGPGIAAHCQHSSDLPLQAVAALSKKIATTKTLIQLCVIFTQKKRLTLRRRLVGNWTDAKSASLGLALVLIDALKRS